MTLKVTDKLNGGKYTVSSYNNTSGVLESVTDYYPSTKSLGVYKSIDSVYDGAFVPNKLRLNPVTIKSGIGTCTSGLMRCNSVYTGCGRQKVEGNLIYAFNPYWGPGWNTQLHSLSKTRATARMNSSEVELGVMLGELGETLNLIRHPLRSLSRDWKRYRKAVKKAAKLKSVTSVSRSALAMDAASGVWLQYRYGILPLVSDIIALQKAYMDKVSHLVGEFRSKRAQYNNETNSVIVNAPWGISSFTFGVYATRKIETWSSSVVYYQYLLDLEARHYAEYWGLGPTQIPSVAYELVPFSFVADWFVNFGEWLRAISPVPGLTRLGGCTSQKVRITDEYKMVSPLLFCGSKPLDEYKESRAFWTSNILTRVVDTPGVGSPTFNADWMDFNRTISALSLIWQRAHH